MGSFKKVEDLQDLTEIKKGLENHLPLSSQMLNVLNLKLSGRFVNPTVVDFFLYIQPAGLVDPYEDPFVVSIQQNIHSLYGILIRGPSSLSPSMVAAFDDLIDWGQNPLFMSVPQSLLENYFRKIFLSHGTIVELPCVAYNLDPKIAITFSTAYSFTDVEGTVFKVGSLSHAHIDQVLENYTEWAKPHSRKQVEMCLDNLGSSGIRLEESLCAWAIQSPTGLINILHTEPALRGKGLGVRIMQSMGAKVADSLKLIPRAESELGGKGEASRKVMAKAGFSQIGYISWVTFQTR